MEMSRLQRAREALLNLHADALQFEFDPDADTDAGGRPVDCSRVIIICRPASLTELIQALGFNYNPQHCDPVSFLEDQI